MPFHFTAEDQDFWDIAAFYTADWNSIKLSAAAAYTWQETGSATREEVDLFQAGASIMHKPSGLGIFGMYQTEESSGFVNHFVGFDGNIVVGPFDPVFLKVNNPDTDAWYVKPFWRKAWSPIGATVLYGEYGQYNDQFFAGGVGTLCNVFFGLTGTSVNAFCNTVTVDGNVVGVPTDVFTTGSEVQRFGLGVVQEIDSAAMHLFARWQHQEIDLNLAGFSQNTDIVTGDVSVSRSRVKQGFDDFDIFQVGGIIFF